MASPVFAINPQSTIKPMAPQSTTKEPTFSESYNKAIKENKPLIVWVKTIDTSIVKEFENCIHVRVDYFDDLKQGQISIGKPYDINKMERIDIISPTVEKIKSILNPDCPTCPTCPT